MKDLYSIEELREALRENNALVERVILLVNSFQSEDEKVDRTAHERNGQGFNKWTAEVAGPLVKWISSGKHLTGSHLERGRKVAILHAKQALAVINQQAKVKESDYLTQERLGIQEFGS